MNEPLELETGLFDPIVPFPPALIMVRRRDAESPIAQSRRGSPAPPADRPARHVVLQQQVLRRHRASSRSRAAGRRRDAIHRSRPPARRPDRPAASFGHRRRDHAIIAAPPRNIAGQHFPHQACGAQGVSEPAIAGPQIESAGERPQRREQFLDDGQDGAAILIMQ